MKILLKYGLLLAILQFTSTTYGESKFELDSILQIRSSKIVYILSPEDCNVCLKNIIKATKSDLLSKTPQLLIFTDCSEDLNKRLVKEFQIDIPTYAMDKSEALMHFNNYGFDTTPFCILLDYKNDLIDKNTCNSTYWMNIKEISNKLNTTNHHNNIRERIFLPMKLNDSIYACGALELLTFNPYEKCFYVYDYTFNVLIKTDTLFNIIDQIKRQGFSNASVVNPMSLIATVQKDSFDISILDYDGNNNYYIKDLKFNQTPIGKLVHNYKISIDDSHSEAIDFIRYEDDIILSMNPSKSIWNNHENLRAFNVLNLLMSESFIPYQSSSIPISNDYLKCNQSNKKSYFLVNKFFEIDDKLGLYDIYSNTIYKIAPSQDYSTLKLNLTDFKSFDCEDNTNNKSMINKIMFYNDHFFVLYYNYLGKSIFSVLDTSGQKIINNIDIADSSLYSFTLNQDGVIYLISKEKNHYGVMRYVIKYNN